jgi:hypothetical protein
MMAGLPKTFSHRSITARLVAMTAASAVFMVLFAFTFLSIARKQLIAERTEKAHAPHRGR